MNIGAQFGFGGEVEVNNFEIDLNTSYGAAVGLDYKLMEFIAFGVRVSYLSMGLDGSDDSFGALDFQLVPRARYEVNPDLEVYISVPLGGTFLIAPSNADNSLGTNWGIYGGVNYWLNNQFGVFGELGYLTHSVSTETDEGVKQDIDYSLSQIGLRLGINYGL